ncbi:two component transcriptional regulator, winged helix family [Arboricoccus pini]|uniref:Two component transcriptional regulator, winged helix family n=1 Tax=Arboricoccus pini TaxID=1963835 RepID=A0A212QSS1_9PROT|nr:response regulator [Arboricoccus pini]SNB62672.1 two component transcriptional regulator, winged helix family [Arboricoccus pini]
MVATPHILVVDDDPRLLDLLHRYLRQNNYLVTTAIDARQARLHMQHMAFDLMVLDVMLPDQNGMQLTKELRRTDDIPILLLTARGEAEDRIAGLEVGADDYLVKPFEPRELLLRIAMILRRRQPTPETSYVTFGPFSFNLATQELTSNGEAIYLTSGEASLLKLLATEPGKSISRAELSARSNFAGSDRAIDVQIVRLRRKLEEDPRQPRYLLTMRGEGYVLRAANAP